jgi:hypothetical protein
MTLQKAIRCLVYPPTSGPKATIVLRLIAGAVFSWEGLLKFAYANHGGVGRAARDSLRVRPNHDLYLSARRRSRALVARCTAPAAAPSQRRRGLGRRLHQLAPQAAQPEPHTRN